MTLLGTGGTGGGGGVHLGVLWLLGGQTPPRPWLVSGARGSNEAEETRGWQSSHINMLCRSELFPQSMEAGQNLRQAH